MKSTVDQSETQSLLCGAPHNDRPESPRTARQRVGITFAGAIVACVALLHQPPQAFSAEVATWPTQTIEVAKTKVVKIFGAGTVQRLQPYQTGFLVSPQGHVLTMWSYVLDTDDITVICDDGRRFSARLVGGDLNLEVALLEIDLENAPCFSLAEDVEPRAGQWAYVLSNAFGVATGDEPVSVQHTAIAGTTRLEAHRGAFETRYRGPVYVLDMVTNNPGAAGGALIDLDGRLLGMIGKELQNDRTGAWLNFALPTSVLRGATERIISGEASLAAVEDTTDRVENPVSLPQRGVLLIPPVAERTPPYIDVVIPGTPGDAADLRPDDLIVLVGNTLVRNMAELQAVLDTIPAGESLRLTVSRGESLIEVELPPPDEQDR